MVVVTLDKMFIAVDVETQGLDARKFLMGSLVKESGRKEVFYNKKDLWNYIIELGKKERQRGKVLTVYSHNAQYDFYSYADLSDIHLKFYNFKPFICSYIEDEKEIIKFLDSMALFRMSLESLGNIIGFKKMDMPNAFKEGRKISKWELRKYKDYCIRDSEVIIKAIEMIKKKMKEEDVKVKRLITIGQLAISYFLKKVKEDNSYDKIFFNKKYGKFWTPLNVSEIHEAYRGGRVECFNTGIFENVSYVDCNNLYGYISTQIRFPNPKSESKIYEPDDVIGNETVLKEIGVSEVIMKNNENDIGILPVRTGTGNYYPKKGSYIIGTYTNDEIRTATKEGYELLHINKSIIWDEMNNPFKEITPKLYELRNKSNNDFDKFFYKEMQNNCYGKMAQTRGNMEITIDSVEKAREYLKNKWEILKGHGTNYIYYKKTKCKTKSFYLPIVPTLINANARLYMYKFFKKVGIKDLVYTDTDSCIFTGNHLDKFKISKELGDFKILNKNTKAIIYGRKTYSIGDEIKISGFRKKDLSQKDFEKGYVKSKKMITLKTTSNLREVGSFVTEERQLKEQLRQHNEMKDILDNQKVYIDQTLILSKQFLNKINQILPM